MFDLSHEPLAEGSVIEPITSVERWKRKNGEGLVAMDRRAEMRFDRIRALSDVTYPVFRDKKPHSISQI